MGNYDLALEYLQVKLRAATTPMERARTQLAIVEAHLQLEHYQEASVSLQQAEESILNNELSSLDGIARALKVKLLAEQGEVEAAEQIYQEGQSLDFAIDDEESEAFMEESKEAIISAYTKQNRVEEGIALRNQAIESNLAKGAPRKVLIDKKALGKTLIEIGETSAAIRQLEDAAALSDSLGDDEEQAAAYLALGEAWYSTGNALKAVDAYRKYGEAMERVRMKDSKLQQVKGEVLKRQQEILALSKDLKLDESQYELEMNQLRFQRLVIYGLMGLLVIAIVVTWVIHRNAMKSKRMSQLLALKSLRSQMNPHFIFNALNSVNQFIALQDELAANKFLSEFSKLMRLVLVNSQQDFISLGEEREFLELYLKLEHYRFRDKFDYSLMIDDSLDLDSIDIPPLLIQPYIENAIWHGLRYKEGKGSLEVAIKPEGGGILVEIKDDGIGRRQSAALKTDQQKKHQSTGLKNTEQRLLILNKVYQKRCSVQVSDLSEDQTGTRIVLILPSNGKV
ncbi:MAG: histidine kinase [Marinoscillum sp.]